MRRRRDILSILLAGALTCGATVPVLGAPRAGGAVAQPATDPAAVVDVGDVLQVSIFEAQGGRRGNSVTLPASTVDCAGAISVPHAGPIHVAGRTLGEIEREIELRLAARAIAPRVSVALLAARPPASDRCAGDRRA